VLRAPKDNAGMTIAGVDGCRGQWLAAVSDGAHVSWLLVPTMRDLYDNRALTVIAIDVPIGLPESGRRACDNQARAALGARGSSVFAAPVRAVLGCATYAEARTVLAALAGPSMSAQAFGIVRAVRDVDGCVGPGDDDRVVETHPELAFLMLS
jgi:predicted RNase H-like nuclease